MKTKNKSLPFIDEINECCLSDLIYDVEEKINDFNDEYTFTFGGDDQIEQIINDLLSRADFYNINIVSDYGCYWCGCLTYEPWDELHKEEEDILNLILQEHLVVKREKIGVYLTFRNPRKSPLYAFFRRHRDGYGENISCSINCATNKLIDWIKSEINKDPEKYGIFVKNEFYCYCDNALFVDEECVNCGGMQHPIMELS